ncbi:DUF3455 domain-containing protein [Candidatus Binatia bacterium]|nr:DUF3455 domain-containing protein [Candidatus Binatia bacterium]
MNRKNRRAVRRALLGLMLTGAGAAPVWALTPPPVPTDLQVPAGFRLHLAGHAVGTQNYVCTLNPSGPSGPEIGWALYGPQATLVSADGQQVMTHFLSPNPEEAGTPRPTWLHSRDSSRVWAKPVATSTDPAYVAADAIPWLKLETAGRAAGPKRGRRLASTAYLQRLNTVGGKAPASGCADDADVGKRALVPYEADYFFYRAIQGQQLD